MAYPTDRVILLDQGDAPLGDLAQYEVIGRVRTEKMNDEHSLTIVTTRRLSVGTRALTVDGTGKWREWVLDEPDELHDSGEHAIGTYHFVWSLQYDLQAVYADEHAEPGMGTACDAATAVRAAIDGTSRWSVGTCDAGTVEAGKGVVMIGESAWDRLCKVVDAWGGEVDAEITVDSTNVVSRKVCLRRHLGSEDATRRFDWSRDVTSIRRTPDPGPYYCRVIPLGKGQQEYAEDDETTFEWPIGIEEENDGISYLQDDEAVEAFRIADGHGGWEYPTKVVKYSEDDPELLMNAALEELHDHTRPSVTYEADVLQFSAAGMDVQGVSLGDDVHIVDRGFNEGSALRLQGRVMELEVDELSPETGTRLTIGNIGKTIADAITKLAVGSTSSIRSRLDVIEGGGTIVYLKNLVDYLNEEINATGGYWYAVPGLGTRTYDKAVSDPAVGTEATKVVEIRGGSIRIADSKTSAGDWNWKSVFVSGHIASELITAANIISGFIGNSDGDFYINLDRHEYKMPGSTTFGGSTVQQIADASSSAAVDAQTQQSIFNKLTNNGQTQGIYLENGKLYVNASYIKSGTISGNYISGGTITGTTISGVTLSGVTGNIGGFTIEDSRLYNDFMVLKNNALLFKNRYSYPEFVGGIVSGINSYSSSNYGVIIGTSAQFMSFTYSMDASSINQRESGGNAGTPFMVFSKVDYSPVAKAGRLTFLVPTHFTDSIYVYENVYSASVATVTSTVTVSSGTKMKFIKGLYVGTS